MNPKTIFISAFFLFASTLCLRAQDTYEYGSVTYFNLSSGLYLGVSTSDNYVESKVNSEFKSKYPFSELSSLEKKVNELSKEGWEVYSTSSYTLTGTFGGVTYHLRRKKP